MIGLDLMEREMRGAFCDFPQWIAIWDGRGWREIPAAVADRSTEDALSADGVEFAEPGTEVTVPVAELGGLEGNLVGRRVRLEGRELKVSSVTGAPGDICVTLTLVRRAVRQ